MTPTEIREARQSLGLTQKQFGELLHATDRTVRMWESGDRNMTLATEELLKIKIKEKKVEMKYCVVAAYDHAEYSHGDIISKHSSHELAEKAIKKGPYPSNRAISERWFDGDSEIKQ